MIDAAAREKMAESLERYLAGESTSFRFDEELDAIAASTKDRTALEIRTALWFGYDDLKEHTIVADKRYWDYLNRLLLILRSDASIEYQSSGRVWRLSQLPAFLGLCLFVYTVFLSDFSHWWPLATIPLGIVSAAVFAIWKRHEQFNINTKEEALLPFGSLTEIVAVRRAARDFQKRKYPLALAEKRVRSALEEYALNLCALPAWLLFPSVALLLLSMPRKNRRSRVVLPTR